MTENEIKLLKLIRKHKNLDNALFVAVQIILSILAQH